MSDDVHEVYAIRYAHHKRPSSANFIHGDPHDVLQPLDYFVWAIVGPFGETCFPTAIKLLCPGSPIPMGVSPNLPGRQ